MAIPWDSIKYFLTGFLIVLLPVYRRYYGTQNFLWLSDIGLFLTIIALWLQSTLIMSIAAVGLLAVELFWNVDFFAHLLFKKKISGLSDYMFDSKYPLSLRILSLFHIVIPSLWMVYFMHHQYDKHAICYFVPLYWVIITMTYWFTDPKENINWVFVYKKRWWPLLLAVGFPLLIVLPTHVLLRVFA